MIRNTSGTRTILRPDKGPWKLPRIFILDYLRFCRASFGASRTVGDLSVILELGNCFLTDTPASASHLVESLGLPPSTVSRCISTLIDQGFLREEIDENDRRIRQLKPTDAGVQKLIEGSTLVDEWIDRIFATAIEEKRARLPITKGATYSIAALLLVASAETVTLIFDLLGFIDL
jgi:DNA-binding MarR family transcriptional regulator